MRQPATKPQHESEQPTPSDHVDAHPVGSQRQQAATHLMRRLGNRAFTQRIVNNPTVQRQDNPSTLTGLADYTSQAAPTTDTPTTDTPTNAPPTDAPAETPAAAPENTGPTTDTLLNEWIALHTDQHLATDTGYIYGTYPRGGKLSDLSDPFQSNVRALVNYVAATEGAVFTITSYARTPQKQHVMHASQYIAQDKINYDSFRFDQWPDVVAAGGRDALLALEGEARTSALQNINNPEVLGILWDMGTHAASKAAANVLASGYAVNGTDPCANGGATYAWPTGSTSKSKHGDGKAIDASPASLPDQVSIMVAQSVNWPEQSALEAEFGADNVEIGLDDSNPDGGLEGYMVVTISGLSAVDKRDAFYDLFFSVRSAARAGFADDVHFQAP